MVTKFLGKLSLKTKIISGYVVLILLIFLLTYFAASGAIQLMSIDQQALERQKDISTLWQLENVINEMYRDQTNLIINGQAAAIDSFSSDSQKASELINVIRAMDLDAEEIQWVERIARNYSAFNDLFTNDILAAWNEGNQAQLWDLDGFADININDISSTAKNLEGSFQTDIEAASLHALETSNRVSQNIMIIAVFSILFGIVGGWLLSDAIVKPVKAVARAAGHIAQGDIDQKIIVTSRDEIGRMAESFQQMILYIQEIADAAARIAEGDLSARVSPRSEKDVLGNAMCRLSNHLKKDIGEVFENANQLQKASAQLAEAARQSNQAIVQVSNTIQQISQGINQQTEGAAQTASAVNQVNRAIDGVAKGAKEQSIAVNKASQVTAQINSSIRQVSKNIQIVKQDSSEAAKMSESGAKTVQETIQGMQTIKAKVGVSAQKIEELGTRSSQIGQIIETIDDIASQTNMLALNAAIEAARAGEQGKGFAVVADEVRKLAERSSSATKEIGVLIKSIQTNVTEAIVAMQEGNQEVNNGVTLANHAGEALAKIQLAVDTVSVQTEQAALSTHQINSASQEMVTAMDTVSAVVEENTAATEHMADNSKEVTQSIEHIVSISEENSAAVEEVSASAEQINSQMQEVTASAQALAQMAQALQGIVSHFKIQ